LGKAEKGSRDVRFAMAIILALSSLTLRTWKEDERLEKKMKKRRRGRPRKSRYG
jgi:hypothetical protein